MSQRGVCLILVLYLFNFASSVDHTWWIPSHGDFDNVFMLTPPNELPQFLFQKGKFYTAFSTSGLSYRIRKKVETRLGKIGSSLFTLEDLSTKTVHLHDSFTGNLYASYKDVSCYFLSPDDQFYYIKDNSVLYVNLSTEEEELLETFDIKYVDFKCVMTSQESVMFIDTSSVIDYGIYSKLSTKVEILDPVGCAVVSRVVVCFNNDELYLLKDAVVSDRVNISSVVSFEGDVILLNGDPSFIVSENFFVSLDTNALTNYKKLITYGDLKRIPCAYSQIFPDHAVLWADPLSLRRLYIFNLKQDVYGDVVKEAFFHDSVRNNYFYYVLYEDLHSEIHMDGTLLYSFENSLSDTLQVFTPNLLKLKTFDYIYNRIKHGKATSRGEQISVVVTKAGTIFGINVDDKKVAWRRFFRGIEPLKSGEKVTFPVFLLQNSANFDKPVFTVLFSEGCRIYAIYLDYYNGETLTSKQSMSERNSFDAYLLEPSLTCSSEIDALKCTVKDEDYLEVLNWETHKLVVLPSPRAYLPTLATMHKFGKVLSGGRARVSSYGGELTSNTWSFLIPENASNVRIHSKDPGTFNFSGTVSIVGNDEMYPLDIENQLTVGYCVEERHLKDGLLGCMYLIQILDSQNGNVIKSFVKRSVNSMGPISVVSARNLIIISYTNARSKLAEIASFALYLRNKDTPLALAYRNIHSITNTFSLGVGEVSELYVSKTTYGFVEPLLLARVNDRIMGIPWAQVDPRRSIQGNNGAGVLPYMPQITLDASMIITRILSDTKYIVTRPGSYESTSLLFLGHELGLQCIPLVEVASQPFDILPPSFSKTIIIGLLVSMIILLVALKVLKGRNKLKLDWS